MKKLTEEEKATYQWQMWVPGFGEQGQEKLKQASVLISRVGGVGSVVALELAAAGIGKLVLAHGGNIKPSDLNRQLLMTYHGIGSSRVESAARHLKELNPHVEIEAIPENISESNVERLVREVDLVVDCAPLFEERFAMNSEIVRQKKPMVECAMYDMEAQITTIIPGQTPCLSCLYPEKPNIWKREFPVFGAISGTIACMAATEAIKVISGVGEPLLGKLLICNLRQMTFQKFDIYRQSNCSVCGEL
ncbi:MAG: HesA/MoeB/ThiF family protein [Okeania sp. SIO2C9]|uniref:HesA/MoeB/ThiF family protein n=1 Tax=Okeania sp. SIO2C9 TaxID=2607791 RepID=UPI0013C18A06|nr:HesA/MoeB/ThiF family protein [Okeania sp. SIO2C9]NEQ71899.1 HesA/MoeB/ThiF family protein [Okeania sp. SIO2C9]